MDGMPFMITAAQKAELKDIGFTDEQIAAMTPEDAQRILATVVTSFPDKYAFSKEEAVCTPARIANVIRNARAARKEELPFIKLARFGDIKTELRTDANGKQRGGSLRHDANVIEITGCEGDYDAHQDDTRPPGAKLTFEQALAAFRQAGVSAVLYMTPSNTDEEPHWRAMMFTSRRISGTWEELQIARAALVDRMNGIIGGGFAPESWKLSQSYYCGNIEGRPPVQIEVIDGDPIDLRDDLPSVGKAKTEAQIKAEERQAARDAAGEREVSPNRE